MWWRLATKLEAIFNNMPEEYKFFFNSIENKELKSNVINEYLKNTNLTLNDLQDILTTKQQILNKKNNIQNNTSEELDIIEFFKKNIPFYNWASNKIKKLRKYKSQQTNNYSYSLPIDIIQNRLHEIYDWYIKNYFEHNIAINLNDYSFEDAYKNTLKWHKTLQENSSSSYITPQPSDIIFKFDLIEEHPEWRGWTVRRVPHEDTHMESKLMNNCARAYEPEVEDGSLIMLSLRDPNNKPHVTFGYNAYDGLLQDIGGVNNEDLKNKYKEMLKYFFKSYSKNIVYIEDVCRRKLGGNIKLNENKSKYNFEWMIDDLANKNINDKDFRKKLEQILKTNLDIVENDIQYEIYGINQDYGIPIASQVDELNIFDLINSLCSLFNKQHYNRSNINMIHDIFYLYFRDFFNNYKEAHPDVDPAILIDDIENILEEYLSNNSNDIIKKYNLEKKDIIKKSNDILNKIIVYLYQQTSQTINLTDFVKHINKIFARKLNIYKNAVDFNALFYIVKEKLSENEITGLPIFDVIFAVKSAFEKTKSELIKKINTENILEYRIFPNYE